MRHFYVFAVGLILSAGDLPAAAQAAGEAAPRIAWEVENRFRLFRHEADFQRHVATHRDDGVLGAEARLARSTDGRGWARDMVDRLCADGAGRLTEFCQRDNERERYLTPEDHRVGVMLEGAAAPGSRCIWNFDDGTIPPQQITVGCNEEVRVRLRYGKPTIASVGITAPDGSISQATTEIAVRDLLIAGIGDSIASGEGNPDKPIALSDIGFCFRDFLAAAGSQ